MAAPKKKQIVVTKYNLDKDEIFLTMNDTKYQIMELKKKKEYVKTVYGPTKNETDKPIFIPYRQLKCSKINDIPLQFLKKTLKINNISFFLEVLNVNDQSKDILAKFEIGPKREGWITRDYQTMEIISIPVDSSNDNDESKKDQVIFSFEYPIKGGKLLTKTKELKKVKKQN